MTENLSRGPFYFVASLVEWWKLGTEKVEINVKIQGDTHPRQSTLRGTVRLLAPRDRLVHRLTVALMEFSNERREHGLELRSFQVASNLPLTKDVPENVTFKCLIPGTARLTRHLGTDAPHIGCRLAARAEVAGAWAPWEASAMLNITAHREMMAVFAVLDYLGFKETEWWNHHLTAPDENAACGKAFHAPSHLQDRLDGVSLILQIIGDQVAGKLILNWRETSLTDYLRAMAGGNRNTLFVQFPCKDLLAPNGDPQPLGAYSRLKSALDDALAGKLPDETSLLRPSASPAAQSEELLRPSQPRRDTDTDTLLHPSDRPGSQS